MKPMVFGWKHTSKSAKLIASTLGADFTAPALGNACREGQTVILWGAGMGAHWLERAGRVVNKPEAIANAVDKLATFKLLKKAGVPIPEFTTSPEEAAAWCRKGVKVYGRKNLYDRRGRGITVFNAPREFGGVDAKNFQARDLYNFQAFTKGFDAVTEFKVHVAFGKVRWIWAWAKERDEKQNPLVRNTATNGYYLRRATKAEQKRLLRKKNSESLVKAIKALGLDFGCADVGIDKKGNICIYEVNTAPAIDSYDALLYAKMFVKELKLKDANVVKQVNTGM